eukprot:13686465-Alexandrium_andersonii.AAC.1
MASSAGRARAPTRYHRRGENSAAGSPTPSVGSQATGVAVIPPGHELPVNDSPERQKVGDGPVECDVLSQRPQ